MGIFSEKIIQFFNNQNFVIVSTINTGGNPHSSCKGLVRINKSSSVYLLDLYRGKTFENLKRNPNISITAVDEHKFVGYCLKGKAKIITKKELKSDIITAWEKRITGRITQRIIKNIQEDKGHPRHPEALLPKPEYLIAMKVESVVDLTPST